VVSAQRVNVTRYCRSQHFVAVALVCLNVANSAGGCGSAAWIRFPLTVPQVVKSVKVVESHQLLTELSGIKNFFYLAEIQGFNQAILKCFVVCNTLH
jgi:hypothetical protein